MVEYIYTALPIYDPGFDLPHHPQHFMYLLEPQQHNTCQIPSRFILYLHLYACRKAKNKFISLRSHVTCCFGFWLLWKLILATGIPHQTTGISIFSCFVTALKVSFLVAVAWFTSSVSIVCPQCPSVDSLCVLCHKKNALLTLSVTMISDLTHM